MNPQRRMIIFGPPGSGKGTQAERISEEFNICHISTGDILRESISKKTKLGLEAESYVTLGELVPDNVIIGIIEDRLRMDDCKDGFLLDGFPRNLAQAETLDKILEKIGIKLDSVIILNVKDEELLKRLVNRRTCKVCSKVHHLIFKPPKKKGFCDQCGGELYQRNDDKEETVRNRLNVYKNQTEPLIDFYRKKGLGLEIDGNKNIPNVFEDICTHLKK